MLTFGVDRSAHYENFYRLMADAAAQAAPHGIQIAMKPHGGSSGVSAEILRCLEKVGHPNFKIWYDAGNIIYYTGKDPVAELDPVARYVSGFCAKDCPKPNGEVMSQFGTGKVDFKAVFAKLKSAGFNGPIMVEGVKVGTTARKRPPTRRRTGSSWRKFWRRSEWRSYTACTVKRFIQSFRIHGPCSESWQKPGVTRRDTPVHGAEVPHPGRVPGTARLATLAPHAGSRPERGLPGVCASL